MPTRFALPLEDMKTIARKHGRKCNCDTCEAYALEMRKRHSAEQDRLIRILAHRKGVTLRCVRDWMRKGLIGKKLPRTRYRRRRYVLAEEEIDSFVPPEGTPAGSRWRRNQKKQERFRELMRDGVSFAEIARQLKIHPETASRWAREYRDPPRRN